MARTRRKEEITAEEAAQLMAAARKKAEEDARRAEGYTYVVHATSKFAPRLFALATSTTLAPRIQISLGPVSGGGTALFRYLLQVVGDVRRLCDTADPLYTCADAFHRKLLKCGAIVRDPLRDPLHYAEHGVPTMAIARATLCQLLQTFVDSEAEMHAFAHKTLERCANLASEHGDGSNAGGGGGGSCASEGGGGSSSSAGERGGGSSAGGDTKRKR